MLTVPVERDDPQELMIRTPFPARGERPALTTGAIMPKHQGAVALCNLSCTVHRSVIDNEDGGNVSEHPGNDLSDF